MIARATDDFYIDQDLINDIENDLVEVESCRLYEVGNRRRVVRAPLKPRHSGFASLNVTRALWHRYRGSLRQNEELAHTCENTGFNGKPLCANLNHLEVVAK